MFKNLDCWAFVESAEYAKDLTIAALVMSAYIGFDDARRRQFSTLFRIWQTRGFEFDRWYNPSIISKICMLTRLCIYDVDAKGCKISPLHTSGHRPVVRLGLENAL